MNDEVDIANDRAMEDTERAINAARSQMRPSEPTDMCSNGCGEKSASHSRWCSPDCRDDYEHRKRMKRIGGNG